MITYFEYISYNWVYKICLQLLGPVNKFIKGDATMNKIEWNKKLKKYSIANSRKSTIQIINSVIPYLFAIITMYYTMNNGLSYWVTLMIAVVAAGFLARIFIIFHDCTHLSFFKSKIACTIWGHIFGVLTFTPFFTWQNQHNIHHGTVGNLDKRGTGDIWTMTVKEYQESSKIKRILYRVYRNPIVLFIIAPIVLFGIINRFPPKNATKKDHFSYAVTNVGILIVFLTTWLTVGAKYYFAIQLPILFFVSILGVWLFFVQHQFEEVYWSHTSEWSIVKAALEGSSFYKLPPIIEWFTGYIGYHNIHHLNSRIPNYNLKKSYCEIPELQTLKTITILESFKLAMLYFYDEKSKKLINLRQFKTLEKKAITISE